MVVHQNAPTAAERALEIGVEIRPELRTGGAGDAPRLRSGLS
jgi:hypothetical protein